MIGKFDILATVSYIQAKNTGSNEEQAKQHGAMVAIMGAMGAGRAPAKSMTTKLQEAVARSGKKGITSADFDKVIFKMGEQFFRQTFVPGLETMLQSGLNYDKIKVALQIPAVRGAKISDADFVQRIKEFKRKAA